MAVQEPGLPYQQILDNVRRLSPDEQLALVSDIVGGLRKSAHNADESLEANLLTNSATFQRLVENSLEYIAEGKARPIDALFDEL